MTDEEKENWQRVHYRKDDEGFHYCFHSYSSWEEIKDDKFQKLRIDYLKAAKELDEYIEQKAKQSEEED